MLIVTFILKWIRKFSLFHLDFSDSVWSAHISVRNKARFSSHAFLLPLFKCSHSRIEYRRTDTKWNRYEFEFRSIDVDCSQKWNLHLDFLPVEFVQTVNNSHEWLVAHSTNNESIQIVWPSLAQTISFREMKLSRCLNCHIYTHMNNLPSNQILINRNLFVRSTKSDSQSWEKLQIRLFLF